MTAKEISELQTELNRFTNKYLKSVTPLIVDGDVGVATQRRIRWVKYYLGYGKTVKANNPKWTAKLVRSLRHPHSKEYNTEEGLKVGRARRIRQRARATTENFKALVSPGVTKFDGIPCAVWLARKLQRARDAGRWQGKLRSGWRSPAYSESLCRHMCNAPKCPGKCAGRSSNHSGSKYPAGAVDVSDYSVFAAECKRLDLGIKNELGAQDPVHYSVSGR